MVGEPKKKLGRPYNSETLMTDLAKYGYKINYTVCETYCGFMLVLNQKCHVCGTVKSKSVSPRYKSKQDLVLWCKKNRKKLKI